jgi:hypothetical protein
MREQALLFAATCHEGHLPHHKHVELSTAGIVFLGTPHQGSSMAELMHLLLRIHSIFGGAASASLTSDLPQFSAFLQLQTQQFRAISSHYMKCYCYETVPTTLPSGGRALLVPVTSAVVLSDGESKSLSMPKDHVHMAKFGEGSDSSFQELTKHLRRMLGAAPTNVTARWNAFESACFISALSVY